MAENRVLIIGGGSGGIIAANLLAEEGKKVTLVTDSPVHFFQPANLFIAFRGEPPEKYSRSVNSLLHQNVELILEKVTKLDLENRFAITEKNRKLDYDVVVVAAGASLDYDSLPGMRESLNRFGDYYSTPQSAVRLWETIRGLKKGKFVIGVPDLIIKCPPAPHKGTFLSASFFKKEKRDVSVELLYPSPHAYTEAELARTIEKKMEEFGNISVRTSFLIDSIDVERKVVVGMNGEEVAYDALAVIPFHKGPKIEINPADARDEDGFIKVDKNKLSISSYDDAYAIGDCTNAPTSKTGVAAHLGAFTVWRRIRGENAVYTGRTNCPMITDNEAIFVISDYENKPVGQRFSKLKRLMEDLFVSMYFPSLMHPRKFEPIFNAYFEATEPSVLGERGW
ncbi:MAG: FAD/NAD(P)-binding oxidoreductase [Fervidicoccaceae archaeon]